MNTKAALNFMLRQPLLRIYWHNQSGYGEGMAAINLYKRILELGYKGNLEVIYKDICFDDLKTLLNLPDSRDRTIIEFNSKIKLVSQRYFEENIHEFPMIELGYGTRKPNSFEDVNIYAKNFLNVNVYVQTGIKSLRKKVKFFHNGEKHEVALDGITSFVSPTPTKDLALQALNKTKANHIFATKSLVYDYLLNTDLNIMCIYGLNMRFDLGNKLHPDLVKRVIESAITVSEENNTLKDNMFVFFNTFTEERIKILKDILPTELEFFTYEEYDKLLNSTAKYKALYLGVTPSEIMNYLLRNSYYPPVGEGDGFLSLTTTTSGPPPIILGKSLNYDSLIKSSPSNENSPHYSLEKIAAAVNNESSSKILDWKYYRNLTFALYAYGPFAENDKDIQKTVEDYFRQCLDSHSSVNTLFTTFRNEYANPNHEIITLGPAAAEEFFNTRFSQIATGSAGLLTTVSPIFTSLLGDREVETGDYFNKGQELSLSLEETPWSLFLLTAGVSLLIVGVILYKLCGACKNTDENNVRCKPN